MSKEKKPNENDKKRVLKGDKIDGKTLMDFSDDWVLEAQLEDRSWVSVHDEVLDVLTAMDDCCNEPKCNRCRGQGFIVPMETPEKCEKCGSNKGFRQGGKSGKWLCFHCETKVPELSIDPA